VVERSRVVYVARAELSRAEPEGAGAAPPIAEPNPSNQDTEGERPPQLFVPAAPPIIGCFQNLQSLQKKKHRQKTPYRSITQPSMYEMAVGIT
jgi:hypothetical protein